MLTLIQGGRVIDPGRLDTIADIIIQDDKIAAIIETGKTGAQAPEARFSEPVSQTIDAAGKIVCPGLIDMHVHFREPGDEEEETIASGSAAAVAGVVEAAVRAEAMLRAHDRGEHTDILEGHGTLSVDTDPPDAQLHVYRHRMVDRRLELEPGGTVTLIGSTMHGALATMNFTLAGTIRFGVTAMDRGAVITATNDIDANGANPAGNGFIDNTATGDSDETDPVDDSEEVPIDYAPALAIDKTVVSVIDTNLDGLTDAGDVINYNVNVRSEERFSRNAETGV